MPQDVLVVTGGASRIGLACAIAMAGDHGAVVLLDQNRAGLDVAAKDPAFADCSVDTFECDVSDAGAMVDLAGRIEADIGPVRSLITSAGILHNPSTVLDMDLDEHNRVWDVNYHGTLYTIRAFAPAMNERSAGNKCDERKDDDRATDEHILLPTHARAVSSHGHTPTDHRDHENEGRQGAKQRRGGLPDVAVGAREQRVPGHRQAGCRQHLPWFWW